MESEPQNSEFRNDPENFHPCISAEQITHSENAFQSYIRDMTCDFQQCGILTQMNLCSHLLSLETLNAVPSVAEQSYDIQTTSKGSDQTALMRRLV